MKTLFYDCEIVNCIPPKNGCKNPRFTYCKGWDDYKGMGISVIGCYTSWHGYHAISAGNLEIFQALVNKADEIIGFNSISFDDKLCRANDINITTTIDLLCEVRKLAGMPPHYVKGITRGGYSLECLAMENLCEGKSGTGKLAPELWQLGKKDEVIAYCLNDVKLLVELYKLYKRGLLFDPTTGEPLQQNGLEKLITDKHANIVDRFLTKAIGGTKYGRHTYLKKWQADLYTKIRL